MDGRSLTGDEALLAAALADTADDERSRRALAEAAWLFLQQRRFPEALRIFDALVPFPGNHHCNALWAAQRDNTGLSFEPARARRYLAASLPFARHNPAIHLNAAGVLAELGDREAAVSQLLLAAAGGVDLQPHLSEPLLRPLAVDPRWPDLLGPARPTATEPSLVALAHAAFSSGEAVGAVLALLTAWRETRSPRLGDLLDRITPRSGYRAAWIERALREAPAELPERLERETSYIRDDQGGYHQKGATGRRLKLLADCDDPRVGTAFVALLADPPPMPARKRVQDAWQAVLDTLVALGDVRVLDPLDALAAGPPPPGVVGEWLWGELGKTVDALLRQRSPEPLEREDQALCAELEAALPPAPFRSLPHAKTPVARSAAGGDPAPLRSALAAVESGDLPTATARLLGQWRRTRSPRLADLLDLVDDRAARPGWVATDQEAWLAVALRDDVGDTPHLVGSLVGDDAPASAERIWALKDRRDPRLASALIRLLADPPFLLPRETGNGVEEVWDGWMAALVGLCDARSVAPVEALAERVLTLTVAVDAEAREDMYTQRPIGPYLAHQLGLTATALRQCAPAVPLSAEEEELCLGLEAAFTPEREARAAALQAVEEEARVRRELQVAIADHPDDDRPRLAYADRLCASDDPHGELIRLQIARARGEPADLDREEELLAEGRVRWLGALGTVGHSEAFERGFPSAMYVSVRDRELPRKLIGHLGWATIERLTISGWMDHHAALVELVGHPILRSLRSIHGLTAEGLVALTRSEVRPYEAVGLVSPIERWTALLAALDRLPALATLHLELPFGDFDLSALAPLLASTVCARVPRLVVSAPSGSRSAWPRCAGLHDAVARSRFSRFDLQWGRSYGHPTVTDGVLAHVAFNASFRRDAAGRLSELRVFHVAQDLFRMRDLLGLLYDLPPDALTRFVLEPTRVDPTEPALDELRRMLSRFPDLTTVELPAPRDVRAEVASRLGQLAGDDYAAGEAARTLGELGATEARAAVAACVGRAPNDYVALPALFGLSAIADRSVVPALRAAIRRPEWPSASMAALILGGLRATEAAPDLIWLLEHTPTDDGSRRVLEAMGLLGEPQLVSTIAGHLGRSLDRIDLRQARVVRRAAVDALGILGEQSGRDAVIRALGEGDLYDRRAAALALGRVGAPGDLSLLRGPIGDPDPPLRTRALLASLALAPDRLTPDSVDSLLRAFEAWEDVDTDFLLPLGSVLGALADRLVRTGEGRRSGWRSVGLGALRFVESNGNRARGQLLDPHYGLTWNGPTLQRWVEGVGPLMDRWNAAIAP